MRSFLRGRPGPILAVGLALTFYGLFATFFLMAFGWGGFLNMPMIVQIAGFGFTATIFVGGIALASIGTYRCCRRLVST